MHTILLTYAIILTVMKIRPTIINPKVLRLIVDNAKGRTTTTTSCAYLK